MMVRYHFGIMAAELWGLAASDSGNADGVSWSEDLSRASPLPQGGRACMARYSSDNG